MADNTQYQDDQGELDVPEQPLSQDYDTPAAPTEGPDDLEEPKDHPLTDSGVDETEEYDAGRAAASGYNAQHVDDSDDDESRMERIA